MGPRWHAGGSINGWNSGTSASVEVRHRRCAVFLGEDRVGARSCFPCTMITVDVSKFVCSCEEKHKQRLLRPRCERNLQSKGRGARAVWQ